MVLETTFTLPEEIVAGLADGTYTRFGGVIRNAHNGQIVTFLQELGRGSAEGFSGAALPVIPGIPPLLALGAAVSIVNLGITTIGFALVMHRLSGLERRLQQAQAALQHIDAKIDIAFYANFRAALDMAINAFTMQNPANRRDCAFQAINRFAEARHHYTPLTDQHLADQTKVADEYLSTLTLAYLSETSCYLLLEETDSAARLLREGSEVLRTRTRRYVESLLTAKPAIYLHPALQDQISLRRLTGIFQWLEPSADPCTVFEDQRQHLFDLAQQPGKWIESLPPAIWDPRVDAHDQPAGLLKQIASRSSSRQSRTAQAKIDLSTALQNVSSRITSMFSGSDSVEGKVLARLPAILATMEAIIEDTDRIGSYGLEVEAMRQLGLSFEEWRQLPAQAMRHPDASEYTVVYVIPSTPVGVSL